MTRVEITREELDELAERGTTLYIKVKIAGEPTMIEAQHLYLVPLEHNETTDDGRPWECISGGAVVLIDGPAVLSDPSDWPNVVHRAFTEALKE